MPTDGFCLDGERVSLVACCSIGHRLFHTEAFDPKKNLLDVECEQIVVQAAMM